MSKDNFNKIMQSEDESADVRELITAEKIFPSVSILLPVNKKYPQYKEEELRLKTLIKKAEEQMKFELSEKMAAPISEKLHKIITTIDFTHLSESLAVFVSSTVQKVIHLSFPVEEKLIIGRTFELRDLLYAAKNNFHYIVLTLSENQIGFYKGYNHHLEKVPNEDFPYGIDDVGGKGHSRDQSFTSFGSSKNVSDQKDYFENQIEKYLRDVDAELSRILKQTNVPVIMCGVEKEIAKFRDISKNTNAILGYIEGNFDHASVQDILKKAEPIFIEKFKADQKKTLALLDEAVGKRNYASGIQDVWKSVMEKRGRLLVVEKDYRFAARVGNNKFTLVTTDIEEGDKRIMKDVVDDIMEYVFLYGGDVAFVENGALPDHTGIALITYYA